MLYYPYYCKSKTIYPPVLSSSHDSYEKPHSEVHITNFGYAHL